ncbi:MAG: hypothetical protein KDH20_13720 [Rhodocyclaceae bacterium]|nr:hypothetical protein [Rhodocyclaceae bacterium]
MRARGWWALAGAAVLFFALWPHFVSIETVRLLLLEDGLIESLAATLWIGVALVALLRRVPPSRLMVAYAVVFLVLALRESGALSGLSGGGKQALKVSFYLGETGAPLTLRIGLAAALCATLWALLQSAFGTLRNLRGRGELDRRTLARLTVGGCVLVCSQLFEVAQDWVSDWGALAHPLARSFWSVEECLEAVSPAIMAYALLRLPSRSHGSG